MKKIILIVAGFIAVAALGLMVLNRPGTDDREIVSTQPLRLHQGLVIGLHSPNNPDIQIFNGIPYATAERWKKPASPPQWGAEVRHAQNYGPECMQSSEGLAGFQDRMMEGMGLNWFERRVGRILAANVDVPERAEDCLFLNVRTANIGKPTKQPVFVWIHGGSHVAGSGSTELYQSDRLVENGIVLVTINYRLGAFGYLAHPTLTEADGTSGNYGLLDQIAALRWVQENISLFGGDPSRVTVAGESAGAQSISELMASPRSQGLFQQAILQSGVSAHTSIHLTDERLSGIRSAEEVGAEFLDGLAPKDNSADTLRKIDASEILQRATDRPDLSSYFLPVVDGKVLPDMIARSLRKNTAPKLPMLIGYNADEATLFYELIKSPTILSPAIEGSMSERHASLANVFGKNEATALQALYDMQNLQTWDHGAIDMLGDDLFGAPARFLASLNARNGAPTYMYIFTREWPSKNQTLGASHAAEISFMMDTHPAWMKLTSRDKKLTDAMVGYWSNFVKTGDPNGADLVTWPRYSPDSDRWLELGDQIKAVEAVRARKLDILEQHIHRRADAFARAQLSSHESVGETVAPLD